MRTQLRRQITIRYAHLIDGAKDAAGDKIEAYSETILTAYGSAVPATSKLLAELYGLRIQKMKSLTLTGGDISMQEGDGVWLPGEVAAKPPWRCVSALPYTSHVAAVIERR